MEELAVVEGQGIQGDDNFGRRHRQILFLSSDTLNEFGYQPGQLREQVTIELSGLQQLPVGAPIQIGEASFEIEQDCAPCSHMAQMLGEDQETFKASLSGKRGMFVTTSKSGIIRIGDPVKVLTS